MGNNQTPQANSGYLLGSFSLVDKAATNCEISFVVTNLATKKESIIPFIADNKKGDELIQLSPGPYEISGYIFADHSGKMDNTRPINGFIGDKGKFTLEAGKGLFIGDWVVTLDVKSSDLSARYVTSSFAFTFKAFQAAVNSARVTYPAFNSLEFTSLR